MGAGKLEAYSDRRKRKLVEEVRTLRSQLAKLERVEVKTRPKTEDISHPATLSNENPNPVLRISKDCIILYANDASRGILETWGCKTGQRLPQPCTEWTKEALSSGKISTFEFTCNDGLVFLLTLTPVADAGYVNVYGVDITERKQAEELMRSSEEKYRVLFEGHAEPVTILDRNGIVLMVNAAGARNMGLSQEESVGKSIFELPGIDDSLHEVYQQVIDTGISMTREDFLEVPSGHRWFWSIHQPISDINGTRYGVQIISYDITERKQAEEELQKLATVVRHSTELVNLATLDGKMIFLNEAGSQMLGIDPDEVEQINIMQVIPEHLKQLVNTEVLPTLKDSRIWEGDVQYLNLKTGKLTDVHAITFTVQDPLTSEPLYLANISRDITARKQAENELRQAKEFTDNAINAQIDTFFVFNPKTGKAIRWNENFSRISGYTDEEISVMKTPDSYYDEDDLEKADEGLKELAATGSATIELSLITKKGKRIPFEYKVSLIKITGGENIAISIGRDITERKRAEEQVERIFNMTGYMVCVADLEGSFIRVNSSFEQILGYSSEELLKRPYLDLIHPDDKDKTIAVLKDNLSCGIQVIGFENRYRCKDGSYKWLSWTSRPVVEEGVTYAIAYDITERKTARDEADRHQAEAAHAARLSSIGEMASALAHELNQPLCAILTHAEGCLAISRQERADMEKLRSKLATVAKQAERAGVIISRIRGFARKEKAQKSAIDLNEVIGEVISLIHAQVERAEILIELNPDEGVHSVPANRVQIEQVILNLVRNSVDAMQDAEPANRKLTITTSTTPDNTVEVAIRDRGKGIDKKNVERIFQPFFTTKPRGLGLGLSISQSIVESHNGRLYVKENSDKGATFCLALPAIPEKA